MHCSITSGWPFGSRGNSLNHLEDLITIDTATGIHTPIGSSTDVISDIAFAPDGTLCGCTPSGAIYTIDPATGVKTFLFNTGIASLSGLTAEPDDACYADCDTTTGRGVLDIFDFLCFGNRFAANDPYACDCDTSTGLGVCDIFDFLCFGNAFAAGCP